MTSPTHGQKRVLWRRQHARSFEAWVAAGCEPMRPDMPRFPEAWRCIACGAKTRSSTACKLTGRMASIWYGLSLAGGPRVSVGLTYSGHSSQVRAFLSATWDAAASSQQPA